MEKESAETETGSGEDENFDQIFPSKIGNCLLSTGRRSGWQRKQPGSW